MLPFDACRWQRVRMAQQFRVSRNAAMFRFMFLCIAMVNSIAVVCWQVGGRLGWFLAGVDRADAQDGKMLVELLPSVNVKFYC